MANEGHNSGDDTFEVTDEQIQGGNIAADELRQLIERAERLEEEKKGIADDIKDVFAEAKGRGYDAKTMKRIMTIRKMKKEQGLLETYMEALGML